MPFNSETPARIGIVGAGNIARRYVDGMARFPQLRVVGCTDLVPELAAQLAADYGFTAFPTLDELIASPEVDIVVNITPPLAHAEVTARALRAGKHVYVEKPITATTGELDEVLAAAAESGARLGSAPDTFLGSAAQTARRAIDEGLIGTPMAATAFITHNWVETWHPDPTFLFTPGGGPALDMGPYYLTSLVNLLGPVVAVSGKTRVGSPVRTVTTEGRRVDRIEVTVPTHWTGILEFEGGALATLMMSFDVWDAHLPKIEIYGEHGTISLPDPNEFDGDVLFKGHEDDGWTVLEPVIAPSGAPGAPVQFMRGMGVADLAAAIDGGPSRANADLAAHVLEVIEAIQRSSDTGRTIPIQRRAERPEPAAATGVTA